MVPLSLHVFIYWLKARDLESEELVLNSASDVCCLCDHGEMTYPPLLPLIFLLG